MSDETIRGELEAAMAQQQSGAPEAVAPEVVADAGAPPAEESWETRLGAEIEKPEHAWWAGDVERINEAAALFRRAASTGKLSHEDIADPRDAARVMARLLHEHDERSAPGKTLAALEKLVGKFESIHGARQKRSSDGAREKSQAERIAKVHAEAAEKLAAFQAEQERKLQERVRDYDAETRRHLQQLRDRHYEEQARRREEFMDRMWQRQFGGAKH